MCKTKRNRIFDVFITIFLGGLGAGLVVFGLQWYSNHSDKEKCIEIFRQELERNKSLVLDREIFFTRANQLSKYIHSVDKNQVINEDSLNSYNDVSRDYYLFLYEQKAFDMLNTSGATLLIKHESMRKYVWETYNHLEQAKQEEVWYMKTKQALYVKMVLSDDNYRVKFDTVFYKLFDEERYQKSFNDVYNRLDYIINNFDSLFIEHK